MYGVGNMQGGCEKLCDTMKGAQGGLCQFVMVFGEHGEAWWKRCQM